MAVTYIECPSCGEEGKIDETLLGRKIKCRKCGTSFLAELGGTYDMVEERPRTAGPSPTRPRAAEPDEMPPSPKRSSDEEDQNSWLEAWPES